MSNDSWASWMQAGQLWPPIHLVAQRHLCWTFSDGHHVLQTMKGQEHPGKESATTQEIQLLIYFSSSLYHSDFSSWLPLIFFVKLKTEMKTSECWVTFSLITLLEVSAETRRTKRGLFLFSLFYSLREEKSHTPACYLKSSSSGKSPLSGWVQLKWSLTQYNLSHSIFFFIWSLEPFKFLQQQLHMWGLFLCLIVCITL